jgi:hypothetical protein
MASALVRVLGTGLKLVVRGRVKLPTFRFQVKFDRRGLSLAVA